LAARMVHGPQAPPLRWLDPLAASDPGIPPAPPDPAGHVGDVLLVSCPGAGLRAVGKPGARRGHVGPALGSRQRMGDGERGGEGWVVWSWRLGLLVAQCSRRLPRTSAVTIPP